VDDIMNFIGLLLVAFALFANLKSYKNIFMSKKKREEAEKAFEESMAKMDETPLGKNITTGMIGASLYVSLFFNFLFYLITSVVVANPIMYGLAVVIFLLNVFGIKKASKSIAKRKFEQSKTLKLSLPLKTLYIIGFFVLFFI
jgi:ABC-type uncharacterized transport system permease subunit